MNSPSNSIKLRAFAFRDKKSGKYYAFCVDLDLVDEGNSFEEVFKKMKENISLYLETEIKYNNTHGITKFPYRKSPVDIMFKYYLLSLACRISFIVNRIKDNYKKFGCSFDSNTQRVHLVHA